LNIFQSFCVKTGRKTVDFPLTAFLKLCIIEFGFLRFLRRQERPGRTKLWRKKKPLMQYIAYYTSPLGKLTAISEGTHVTGLWFTDQEKIYAPLEKNPYRKDLPVFALLGEWLEGYFQSGKDPCGMPPMHLEGTPFQEAVWEMLKTIPRGQVTTYRELSIRLGRPMSAHAVGGAVGHNPISILIPCHRVVGANNRLTGYAGGLWRKKALLEMEGAL